MDEFVNREKSGQTDDGSQSIILLSIHIKVT